MSNLAIGKGQNSYKKLLLYLDSRKFTYTMPMDANRYEDGLELRHRFRYEKHISIRDMADLDDYACSVLEMMLALCIRCEEQIMNVPELGNRTSVWFMEMLQSMELDEMDDEHFDEEAAEYVVDCMLDRVYDYDGHGGLFTCEHCPYDMRGLEIWYQAMWYFNEVLDRQ